MNLIKYGFIAFVICFASSCRPDGYNRLNGKIITTEDGTKLRMEYHGTKFNHDDWEIFYPVLVTQQNGDTLTEWRHYR